MPNRHDRRRTARKGRRALGLIQAIDGIELVNDPLLGEGLIGFVNAYASPAPSLCTGCARPFLPPAMPSSWLRITLDEGNFMGLGALCAGCDALDHRVVGERLMEMLRSSRLATDAELLDPANMHLGRWGSA